MPLSRGAAACEIRVCWALPKRAEEDAHRVFAEALLLRAFDLGPRRHTDDFGSI